MLKRLSAAAAVFFLLTAFLTPAFAGTPFDATTAINNAKQNNSDYYRDYSGKVPGQDKDLHYITSTGLTSITDGNGNSYGFLAYGQPHPADSVKKGQHRYIGYTYYGEDYTNMDYPADKNANGADFTSQHWILQPWYNPIVKESDQNLNIFSGDGSPEYRTAIQAGILIYGGTNANNGFTLTNFRQGTELYDNIEQYVHILARRHNTPGASAGSGM